MKTHLNLAIAKILERPQNHEWSIQGFGMLRLYLSRAVRLHVWSPAHAVDNVSVIHDHPWDFDSLVLAGSVQDIVYAPDIGDPTHCEQQILCGTGGHAIGAKGVARLIVAQDKTYRRGEQYRRTAPQLHESRPAPGTVTLVTRVFRKDPDHARVFFPLGTDWVSAEPRQATASEVEQITSVALARMRAEAGL